MSKKVVYQKIEQEKNRKKAFKIILTEKTITARSLAQSLKVSIPTAITIINDFLEKSILIISEKSEKTSGRQAAKYLYNPKAIYSVGITIEVDSLKIILIDLDGSIIKKASFKEDFSENPELVDFISWELDLFLQEFDEKDKIAGIGISIPGVVHKDREIIELGVNLNLVNKDMSKIGKHFNKTIYIENEANAGALFEYIKNDVLEDSNIIYLSISDKGIGAGTIIDGLPYRGSNDKAGEVGHSTLEIDGRPCNCGNKGCLERYVSLEAFENDFKEFFPEVKNFKDIFLKKLIDTEKGKKIKSKYIKYLSVGIKNLLLYNDPNKIIVGGFISRYPDYFLEGIRDEVFNTSFLVDRNILEFSSHFEDGPLLGAAFQPFKTLYF